MICNIGINDMPRGWMYQSELNKKIYFTWKDMITRCYSENFHKKNPTYKDCTVSSDSYVCTPARITRSSCSPISYMLFPPIL